MQPHNSNDTNTYTVIIKLAAAVILTVFGCFGCANAPKQSLIVETKEKEAGTRLDLNAADASDLEKLPGIGPMLAARIIEHRTRNGRFRDPAQVLLVRGMSDAKFRTIRDRVTVR
jgi:competence ComEA-like helix-hairpin-helix protein